MKILHGYLKENGVGCFVNMGLLCKYVYTCVCVYIYIPHVITYIIIYISYFYNKILAHQTSVYFVLSTVCTSLLIYIIYYIYMCIVYIFIIIHSKV